MLPFWGILWHAFCNEFDLFSIRPYKVIRSVKQLENCSTPIRSCFLTAVFMLPYIRAPNVRQVASMSVLESAG